MMKAAIEANKADMDMKREMEEEKSKETCHRKGKMKIRGHRL